MPTWAMVIDTDSCIGCHACTIACKSEHQVALGVNRCWVKSVEKGAFPTVGRSHLPVLCNQCADAPCQTICPTGALFRRPDGIVDLDHSVCIGCKSCMAACPYDQLFIDPDFHVAEKCNFCANRIDNGLLPSCVQVCPTQCRIFGDLEDPTETVSRLVAGSGVQRRKLELGTGPKIFYLGAEQAALDPLAATGAALYREGTHDDGTGRGEFVPGALELPFEAGAPRIDYNVSHQKPWGEALVAYLATKGVAAGVLLVAGSGLVAGLGGLLPLVLSLVFLSATSAILVADLKQPARFYLILTRPNPRSWLVRGTWLLIGQGLLVTALLGARLAGSETLAAALMPPAMLVALGVAVYSGLLFAQARGREFWQGLSATVDLAFQAPAYGAAALLLAGGAGVDRAALGLVLAGGLALHLMLVLGETVFLPVHSRHLAAVKRSILHGRHAALYYGVVVLAGGLVPLLLGALAIAAVPETAYAAALLALAGLYAWDHIWVHAGQEVPLS